MARADDFYFGVDRAAGLITDAGSSLRALLRAGRLPTPHKQIITRVVRRLEADQDDLFTARNSPWQAQPKPGPVQLELL